MHIQCLESLQRRYYPIILPRCSLVTLSSTHVVGLIAKLRAYHRLEMIDRRTGMRELLLNPERRLLRDS